MRDAVRWLRRVARLRMWVCVLAVGVVFAPKLVYAEKTYHFFSAGYGKHTCYDYLAASEGLDPSKFNVKTIDRRKFVSESLAYDEWIYGYYSGLNFDSAVGGNKRADVEVQTSDIISWTRDWCRSRPNATVFESVKHFMEEHWAHPNAAPPQPNASAAQADQGTAPPATGTDPMFVYVTFQDDASSDDKNAFLQAYSVFIVEGPNAAGAYKLRLSGPLPPDQLEQVLASMRTQTRVVKGASAN